MVGETSEALILYKAHRAVIFAMAQLFLLKLF